MKYNAANDTFSVTHSDLKRVADDLRYAMRNIRKASGLPMDKYERGMQLTHAEHAQKGIIDAAEAIGIDFGARWGNELDLRDKDELANIRSQTHPTEPDKTL